MNGILKTFLILIGGICVGFGLGVLFLSENYVTHTNALIILILSLTLGGFILGSAFLKKQNNEQNQSKKENSDDNSGKGI